MLEHLAKANTPAIHSQLFGVERPRHGGKVARESTLVGVFFEGVRCLLGGSSQFVSGY